MFIVSRIALNIMYFLLFLWLVIHFISYKIPLIVYNIVVLFYWSIFPFVSLLFFFCFFFWIYKWLSVKRIMSFIFLIPIIIIMIIPILNEKVRLYTSIPNEKSIESYFVNSSKYSLALDTSVNYNNKEKILDLYIKIEPEIFKQIVSNSSKQLKIEKEKESSYFINKLYLNFITLPSELVSETRVPKLITVYGYWGDSLIMQASFRQEKNKYQIVEPYPNIDFIGNKGEWYLEYELNNVLNQIFIQEGEGDFRYNFKTLILKEGKYGN
ncbi:hypothetical protein ABEW34_20740 [Paenibacillus algorifonticola]|uniref:hypothetical protein n=1 Tax=Paenibacillus algorifonticola TaxID=684063 RepID=UPI003D277D46